MPGLIGLIAGYFIVSISEQDHYQNLQNPKVSVLIVVKVELVLRWEWARAYSALSVAKTAMVSIPKYSVGVRS